MYRILILISLFFTLSFVQAQSIPVHLTQRELYDFLDELANDGHIQLNSAVKPYSKQQVFRWLMEAYQKVGLTKRQKKQIEFYSIEYGFQSSDTTNLYGERLNLIKKMVH